MTFAADRFRIRMFSHARAMRIALFITCFNDTLFPQTGQAAVEVLERLGQEVAFPEEQTCCGQMHFNTGYRDEALGLIRRFVRRRGGSRLADGGAVRGAGVPARRRDPPVRGHGGRARRGDARAHAHGPAARARRREPRGGLPARAAHGEARRGGRGRGLLYPPDPGSRTTSTIGGNVAENAGGLRGLKYGVTRD